VFVRQRTRELSRRSSTEKGTSLFVTDSSPSLPPIRADLVRPSLTAPATTTLIVLNVAVWLLMTLSGGSHRPEVLIRFGANLPWRDLSITGQYWRLLSSMFLHVGLVHLFMNAFGLYVFGASMERLLGTGKYLAVYFISGLVASLASSLLPPDAISAGASGAIFGIIGALAARAYRLARGLPPLYRSMAYRELVGLFVISFLYGAVLPNIDQAAHAGGLLTGVLVTALIDRPRDV